ncbi:MAG: nucleoside hydrolase [Acidobacteria bacterium]|nr:nucleoside hydrolase [Acidobacteriota bacterium]
MPHLILLFLLLALPLSAQPRIPILYDTDIGNDIDDALTLAFLLQSPEFDVRAVTTSRFESETRARLAWKLMRLYGHTTIPIASGAGDALLHHQYRPPAPQFGALTEADSLPEGAAHKGVALLIDTLLRSERKLTIVTVGPLSNVALALKTDPRVRDRIERIVLMGGAVETGQAETNVLNDIGAAAIVFDSGLPVVMAPFDVTRDLHLTGADLAKITESKVPATMELTGLIRRWQTWRVGRDPVLHDLLPLIALLHPEWCRFENGKVDVELASPITRGMTKFTPAARLPDLSEANVRVIRAVNKRKMLDLFLSRLTVQPIRE